MKLQYEFLHMTKKLMLLRKCCLLILMAFVFLPCTAYASQPGDVMIVFDGSGSMRGKVKDGRKINISKTILSKVIDRWSDIDVNVGLIAYGHSRKKDCSNIETLISPQPIDNFSFKQAVSKIKAVGNTPLSDAVQKAAEELNYTRRRATIILMSDGKENCDRDPCALARALETSGAAFTAHVIALAVDRKDEAGLKCLAEETGGRYIRASNSEDLFDAFLEVGAAQPVTIKVVDNLTGQAITKSVRWLITNAYTRVERITQTSILELTSLPAANYTVRATIDGTSAERQIQVPQGKPALFEIRLNDKSSAISLDGPRSILTLETFSVRWQGPNNSNDRIEFALIDEEATSSFAQSYNLNDYARGSAGHLTFKAPLKSGTYELRYISGQNKTILKRKLIVVNDIRSQN